MNDMVVFQEPRQLSAVDIRAHVNLVQEVMQAVMKGPSKEHPAGVHYGTIPGTPKPTLYKAGAEVLAATFRIAVSYQVDDLSTPELVRYRVTATGTHQTSGVVMGAGMGECSSHEEKYKWRKANSDAEFNATAENMRRVKYSRDYSAKQVCTNPADLANTVLKMACKRAQVAMILNVTAASDIFAQDIEDLPEELRPNEGGSHKEPAAKDTGPKPYTDEQFKKALPVWTGLIKDGKKTPDEIIATVSNKWTLSEQQKKDVAAIKKVEAPVVTFAQVADKLNGAKDRDEADAAADLIGEVSDAQQRTELSALYEQIKTKMEGGE